MKSSFFFSVLVVIAANLRSQNTIPTTTVVGALRVNDSLSVSRDISSSGDITAVGEVVSRDTMRAQKDILVDGNATIGGNLKVAGSTSVNDLKISGRLIVGSGQIAPANPCDLQILAALPDANNSGSAVLSPLNPSLVANIELAFDANPCLPTNPTPPVTVPFTWQTYGNHVNSNNRWIGTIENYDFTVKTNSITRMVVKNNGQVLFGAQKIKPNHPHANSQYQFDGKIGCKELVVVDPTKWADFVFNESYKLLPLPELEAFFTANKHLPDVPSEADIKANGINTAEMDALLLQKIEELTLYIVQQQKEIEALKKKVKN